MTVKDLYESTLKEIDRQMQAVDEFTSEQSLIWTLAARDIDEALVKIRERETPKEPT